MMTMTTKAAWAGGSTFLWTQAYRAPQGAQRWLESLRDAAFCGGLVVLAWGAVFFILG